jgi:hypothetical protein
VELAKRLYFSDKNKSICGDFASQRPLGVKFMLLFPVSPTNILLLYKDVDLPLLSSSTTILKGVI